MDSKQAQLKSAVMELLDLLIEQNYVGVERLTKGVRLSAQLIESAITTYGRTLAAPPASELDRLDAVQIAGVQPNAWSVRVDLWTEEEGRSDLSLEATFRERSDGTFDVEVDDIHVL
jgi:hypothetical protein